MILARPDNKLSFRWEAMASRRHDGGYAEDLAKVLGVEHKAWNRQ